jgi:hypothetical protein
MLHHRNPSVLPFLLLPMIGRPQKSAVIRLALGPWMTAFRLFGRTARPAASAFAVLNVGNRDTSVPQLSNFTRSRRYGTCARKNSPSWMNMTLQLSQHTKSS